MDGELSPKRPQDPAVGDIVVMRVASHYHVSRVVLGGSPWTSIRAIDSESDALTFACGLITGSQRVFLYALGSKSENVLIDCANTFWERR